MSNQSIEYIDMCRENIRFLNTEYEGLRARQKREPNPHRKAQLAREINMVQSEINANLDDIRVTKEIMQKGEVLIELAYQQ